MGKVRCNSYKWWEFEMKTGKFYNSWNVQFTAVGVSSWTRTKHPRKHWSKCEHALATRMLAFRSVHPHFLWTARPIYQSAAENLLIFAACSRKIFRNFKCTKCHLENCSIAATQHCIHPEDTAIGKAGMLCIVSLAAAVAPSYIQHAYRYRHLMNRGISCKVTGKG